MNKTLMNIECRLIDIESKEDLKAQIIPSLGIATYKMIGIQDLYKVPEIEHANNVSIVIDKFDENKLTVSAINGNLISFTNITEKNQTMPRTIKMKIVIKDNLESEGNE